MEYICSIWNCISVIINHHIPYTVFSILFFYLFLLWTNYSRAYYLLLIIPFVLSVNLINELSIIFCTMFFVSVAYKLSKRKPDDAIKLLHTILYGRRAKVICDWMSLSNITLIFFIVHWSSCLFIVDLHGSWWGIILLLLLCHGILSL